jgi:hypothetical protein
MPKPNQIKYIAIAIVVLISVAVYAAVGDKSMLAKVVGSTSTNIAIVKKQKLKYPSETAGTLMWQQSLCVASKVALYQVNGVQYKPLPEEILSREQIIALFDDVTVEEYFSGTNYARIESGKKITSKRGVDDTKDVNDPEKFLCKLTLVPYTKIQIKKIDKTIDIQSNEQGGSVEILNISKELQKYKDAADTVFEPAKTLAVNAKYKCDLSAFDMQQCYLNGMQVHPGTGKYVIVQSVRPEPGSKYDEKTGPQYDALYEEFKGTRRALGQPTIEENISIAIGETIPSDKFEVPDFAKNFKTKIE